MIWLISTAVRRVHDEILVQIIKHGTHKTLISMISLAACFNVKELQEEVLFRFHSNNGFPLKIQTLE